MFSGGGSPYSGGDGPYSRGDGPSSRGDGPFGYNGVGSLQQNGSMWRNGGMLLAVLAALTMAAAIADVTFTYGTFCSGSTYNTTCNGGTELENMITFTWIVPGIWGSLPTFLTAILAIILARDMNDETKRKRFAYVGMATALLVLPAMIVLAALEAYYVVYDGVYSFSSSNDTNSTVKFALPMAVAILGVAAFLVAGFLLLLYYSRRSDDRGWSRQRDDDELPAPRRKDRDGRDEYEMRQFGQYKPEARMYYPPARVPPRPPPQPQPPPPPPPPPQQPMFGRWPYSRPMAQRQVFPRSRAYYPNYFGQRASYPYNASYGGY